MNRPVVFIEMEKLRDLHSGLGQFCFHLGKALTAGYADRIHFLFGVPESCVGIFGDTVSYYPLKFWHKFWLNPNGVDVWHATHQSSPFFYLSGITRKRILTVHDLNILKKYSGLKQSWHMAKIRPNIRRATQLVAISEFTRQEYGRTFVNIRCPISFIYNGNNMEDEVRMTKPKDIPNAPFLLSLGIIQPKKNFHHLIHMLSHLPDHSLVIAGRNQSDYGRAIRQMALESGVSDRLFMPGEVSQAEKTWLLAHCHAFVFPSGAEGFGMPVVEAMHFGKPVFLSRQTSLPEIGGEQAYYFRNNLGKDMAADYRQGMAVFSSDPVAAERIKNRAAMFSWKHTAAEYVKIYLAAS